MNEAAFWEIIEAGGPYPLKAQRRHLRSVRSRLLACSPEQVRDFYTQFCRRMIEAQQWDLWAVAYLINGGCSNDGFVYFRAWLIAQGRAVFSAALADPDSLVAVADPKRDDHKFELLYALPQQVYVEMVGKDMPNIEVDWPLKPAGQRWDFDDVAEVTRRLPRLAATYLA